MQERWSTVLVAGGTDGIGFSLVRRLVEKRMADRIFVLGRDFSRIDELPSQNIVRINCDILQGSGVVREAVDAAIADGSLDVFVNTIGSFSRGPACDLSPEQVADHFALNSVANISLTNVVLRKLRTAEFSQIIVCLASLCAGTRENYALQGATKVAYKYFIDTLRLETSSANRRIMTVHPSSLDTRIFAKGGDLRRTDLYPPADRVVDVMLFQLTLPRDVVINEIYLHNTS